MVHGGTAQRNRYRIISSIHVRGADVIASRSAIRAIVQRVRKVRATMRNGARPVVKGLRRFSARKTEEVTVRRRNDQTHRCPMRCRSHTPPTRRLRTTNTPVTAGTRPVLGPERTERESGFARVVVPCTYASCDFP